MPRPPKVRSGKTVAVVGSGHKVAVCRALGADVVIDKSSQPLWDTARAAAPDGFAAIFDANGVATLAQSYAHLARTGKLVVYGVCFGAADEALTLGAALSARSPFLSPAERRDEADRSRRAFADEPTPSQSDHARRSHGLMTPRDICR